MSGSRGRKQGMGGRRQNNQPRHRYTVGIILRHFVVRGTLWNSNLDWNIERRPSTLEGKCGFSVGFAVCRPAGTTPLLLLLLLLPGVCSCVGNASQTAPPTEVDTFYTQRVRSLSINASISQSLDASLTETFLPRSSVFSSSVPIQDLPANHGIRAA